MIISGFIIAGPPTPGIKLWGSLFEKPFGRLVGRFAGRLVGSFVVKLDEFNKLLLRFDDFSRLFGRLEAKLFGRFDCFGKPSLEMCPLFCKLFCADIFEF